MLIRILQRQSSEATAQASGVFTLKRWATKDTAIFKLCRMTGVSVQRTGSV